MVSITRELAEFVSDLSYGALPLAVVERAKSLVLDSVGIAVRARHDAESTESVLAAVKALGFGHGQATIIGSDDCVSPPAAALINGTLIHSLDFDDTHARGSIHSSAPIVPAALAAAEMVGANGRELLAGIVAGYEVQIRLGLALVPKDHYARGYHPTATCGAFGAAAAAAKIFGLSAAQIADAFGVCLSQTAGTVQFLANGAWTKRFQVGNAAMNGLVAASLAREGFKGAAEAIEGRAGFLRAYAPEPDFSKAVVGLGAHFETLAIAVKPYPCCRYSHAAMDALIALRNENNIGADEIQSVEIGLPQTGWEIIGHPESDKHQPTSIVDGQFSMPFLAAVALLDGGLVWDSYRRHLASAKTLGLCRRVHSVVDPRAAAAFPEQMAAVARVTTSRGRFERFVEVPKGEPENFPTGDEQRAKFEGLAGPYLSPERLTAAYAALMSLNDADCIRAVLRLTHPEVAVSMKVAAAVQ